MDSIRHIFHLLDSCQTCGGLYPFVLTHDLARTLPRVLTDTMEGGAGGETRGDLGRLERMRIGDLVRRESG